MRVSPASVSAAGRLVATATATVESVALSQGEIRLGHHLAARSDCSATPVRLASHGATGSVAHCRCGRAGQRRDSAVQLGAGELFPRPAVRPRLRPALVDGGGRASAVLANHLNGHLCRDSGLYWQCLAGRQLHGHGAAHRGPGFRQCKTPTLILTESGIGRCRTAVHRQVQGGQSRQRCGGWYAGRRGPDRHQRWRQPSAGAPTAAIVSAAGRRGVSVCGGTVPATVQVRASLVSAPAIATVSNILTVQTGLPTQRFYVPSSSQPNFLAGGYFTAKTNGYSTTITAYAADRWATRCLGHHYRVRDIGWLDQLGYRFEQLRGLRDDRSLQRDAVWTGVSAPGFPHPHWVRRRQALAATRARGG